MNTLSRTITASYFSDASAYDALRQHWSALVNSPGKHDLTPAHYLLYLCLLGKDWRVGFTPITNQKHLDNGAPLGLGTLPRA